MTQRETRTHLLETALRLLAHEELRSITTRRIAEEAGVNIAAVNYHFGSKEALLGEAGALFGRKMRELFSLLDNEAMTEELRLSEMVHQFADSLVAYPGFLKTFVAAVIRGQDPPAAAKANIVRGQELILSHWLEAFGGSEEEARNRILQLMSAIVYPAMMGEYAESIYAAPFSDAEFRQRYINQLIETFGLVPKREE